MAYMQIRIIQWKQSVRSAAAQAMVRRTQREAVPLLRAQPGFLDFELASLGSHTTATIMVWKTERDAHLGLGKFVDWLQETGAMEEVASLQRYHGKVLASSREDEAQPR